MKNTIVTKLSLFLLISLAISLGACSFNDPWSSAIYTSDTELGEGSKTVVLQVVVNEHEVNFTIHTDADTLGEALAENDLIEGEESQYGMYIKKVNGVLADYDKDGSYWGFYKNGEYMMSGVDTTPIQDAEHYELVYEK